MAWSNKKLIQLSKRFVPCADEVWRLQHGKDFECQLFRRFADQGHYGSTKSTQQGVYVATPSGRFLGSINTRRVDRLETLLRDALKQWSELSKAERLLDADERKQLESVWRWSQEYPDDGLVLEVLTRDLPRSSEAAKELAHRQRRVPASRRWNDGAWNRDYAWYRAGEARQWLPADGLKIGQDYTVPRPLVERLARFHVVDCVRGQTDAFDVEHLRQAELIAKVRAQTTKEIRLSFHGTVDATVEKGKWPRSLRYTWEGSARWDRKAKRFRAFRLVAVGTREGRTRFNGRQHDPGPSPIGTVLRLADPDAPRVAPTWVYRYGWRPTAKK